MKNFIFFNETLMQKFDDFAHHYCYGPENEASSFLRPYACTNVHEFFSVAIENFFERPEAFRATLPDLYSILVRLLNQDPAQLTSGVA